MLQRSIDPGQIIHTTSLRELKLRGLAPRHQCQNRKFAPSVQGAKFLHLRFRSWRMGQLTRVAQEGVICWLGSWVEFCIKVQRILLHHLRLVEPGQIMGRPTLLIHLAKITGETIPAPDPDHLLEVVTQAKEARVVDEQINTVLPRADHGNERFAQESVI